MDAKTALHELRAYDPARSLRPLSSEARAAIVERVLILDPPPSSRARSQRPRGLRLAVALAVGLFVGVGVAWAAGAISPLQVFKESIQQQDAAPGSLWDQDVVPSSIRTVSSVEIPRVGRVEYWEGRARQGGWCGALQLPDGHWLGTGAEKLDAGGTAPGCYPTREAINGNIESGGGKPVLIIDGFDYEQGDLDARSAGGAFWRINFGRITVPGTVAVRDEVTGKTVAVSDGSFMIALEDENPMQPGFKMHLVALDHDGNVIADNCPACKW